MTPLQILFKDHSILQAVSEVVSRSCLHSMRFKRVKGCSLYSLMYQQDQLTFSNVNNFTILQAKHVETRNTKLKHSFCRLYVNQNIFIIIL